MSVPKNWCSGPSQNWCSGQNVICHLGGTYGNKSVNIKFIYILAVNIVFLFQETLVNANIQVIEASGRGYIVDILIQLTIYGFAWFTAFKYMFLLHLRHYKCLYCKSNLRNGILMPDLYEIVVLFVFLCYLVQKLWNLLTFAIRVWRNPRWPPNEPHGTLVHPVNIDICFLDIIMSLKK